MPSEIIHVLSIIVFPLLFPVHIDFAICTLSWKYCILIKNIFFFLFHNLFIQKPFSFMNYLERLIIFDKNLVVSSFKLFIYLFSLWLWNFKEVISLIHGRSSIIPCFYILSSPYKESHEIWRNSSVINTHITL